MSRSIIAASASILIEIMLLLVLRHPTCASRVAWIVVRCPIPSSMYEHVPINHHGVGIDLTLQSGCCWCYVIQPVHHELHECVVGCPIPSSTYVQVLINHHGVGIDFLLKSGCSCCYVIQPVHHELHECAVRRPILSSMYEHVPIYHRGVGIAIYRNHVVDSATSSNLCIMCCMNVL